MTLATILIVLLIDRLLWRGDPLRQHRWFDGYSDRLLKLATGQWLARQALGGFWFLLPPLLLVAVLQGMSGYTAGLVIGTVVLLFSLGPRDLGRDCDAFLEARADGDEPTCRELAQALTGDEQPDDEPQRSLAVAEGILCASRGRLLGPIFWFIVLGPIGAALYRLAAMTAARSANHALAPITLAGSANRLMAVLDWLPTRLTAAAFAVAGNFDAVSRAWRDREAGEGQNDSDALLVTTGRAALDSWPDDEEIAAGERPPVVEDAMALIWRTLIIWLLGLLVLTLLAALL